MTRNHENKTGDVMFPEEIFKDDQEDFSDEGKAVKLMSEQPITRR